MPDLSTSPAIVGPRPVRAPRGTTLSCRNWLIEAAYRMIQNNLDPEVAENPDALVVYGGIGKAARNWDCFEAILKSLRALGDDETLLVQSGKPVGVFRTHARCAARADRQLQPGAEVGDLGALPRARPQGPDDVRPDDGRLVDLHRQPGHRPGHVRDLRRGRTPALRRRPGGALDPHRGPRRHGRRAAARGELRRRVVAHHRVPAVAHRLPPEDALPRRAGERPRRRARAHRALHEREARGLGRPARQRRRDRCPSCCAARAPAARGPISSPTRPRRTTWSTATCPRAGRSTRWQGGAGRRPTQHAALRARCRAELRRSHVQAMLDFQTLGVPVVDYGNNIRQVAFDEGVANAFDFPGFVPAYIRPLFCRGKGPFRWVALSGDPDDISKTDAKLKELFPDERAPAPLARHGGRAHRLPGPAGAHLLDRPRRASSCRARIQRDGEVGRAEGADRDRPRPSRQPARSRARTARPRR